MSPGLVSKSSPRRSLRSLKGLLSSCLIATLWSCVGIALAQDYFPLHVGNQWVYRVSGAPRPPQDHIVLSIERAQWIDGEQWVLLHGLPVGDYWLKQDEQRRLWARKTEKDPPGLWYDFAAREGENWQQQLPYCCGVSRITSRKAEYKGPAGEFGNLLEIRYPGVFQIGLDRELFLPYTGMVHRSQNTGGPSVAWMDLIYARTGGVTVIAEPSTAFLVTVDTGLLPAGISRIRLNLRHTGVKPLRLDFPTSKIYDVRITDAKGETVWLWSSTALFLAEPQSIVIEDSERNWVVQTALPDGRYFAEAWLESGDPPRYWARVAFEVKGVR